MKIRMTKTAVFAGGCYLQGQAYDVPREVAAALVSYESAVFVDPVPAKQRQKAVKQDHYETR